MHPHAMPERRVVRRRRIDPRRRRWERVVGIVAPRHLTRAARSQRIALIVIVVLFGLYLLVAPMIDFGGSSSTSSSGSARPSPSKGGLKERR
jgi:hypothetical protein